MERYYYFCKQPSQTAKMESIDEGEFFWNSEGSGQAGAVVQHKPIIDFFSRGHNPNFRFSEMYKERNTFRNENYKPSQTNNNESGISTLNFKHVFPSQGFYHYHVDHLSSPRVCSATRSVTSLCGQEDGRSEDHVAGGENSGVNWATIGDSWGGGGQGVERDGLRMGKDTFAFSGQYSQGSFKICKTSRRRFKSKIFQEGDGHSPVQTGSSNFHHNEVYGTCNGENVPQIPFFRLGGENGTRRREIRENAFGEVKWRRLKRLNRFLDFKDRFYVPEIFNISSGGSKAWKHIEYNKDWFLHAPIINTIPWETFLHIYNSKFLTPKEKEVFEYLYDPSLYRACESFNIDIKKSKFEEGDIDQLLKNNLFEVSETEATGYVFSVGEVTKERRRLVHDALLPNSVLEEPFNPCFKTIPNVKKLCNAGSYAFTVDFKCYFYQFPIIDNIRKYFTVASNGRRIQPTRLPMGFKWAVNIAQIMTKFLVYEAFGNTNNTDIYIDNIFCVCKDQWEGKEKLNKFLLVCKKYGITVGDISEGEEVIHRGMVLNLKEKSVCLKNSFVEKFKRRLENQSGKWAEIRSLLGMIIYGFTVFSFSYGNLFHIFKLWAKCIKKELHETVVMNKTEIFEWDRAIFMIKNNSKLKIVHTEKRAIIITDAAMDDVRTGLGGILVTEAGVKEFKMEVRKNKPLIAKYEMMAVRYALNRWEKLLKKREICILCDNTVTLCALNKGMSSNFILNEEVLKIEEWKLKNEAEFMLFYIYTKDNPADPLSRNQELSKHHTQVLSDIRAKYDQGWSEWVTATPALFPESSVPILSLKHFW